MGPGTILLESSSHPSALSDEAIYAQCRMTRGRTSGPGGQHRNKVESKVTLEHLPTGVEAHAGERRSSEENRRVAIFRLRLLLAVRARCAVPAGDVRSALWRSRCRGGRVVCNPEHRDYPALLAEALDMVAACGHDPTRAALRLECTTSQLIKLVKEHAPAFEAWNRAREEAGLHLLH